MLSTIKKNIGYAFGAQGIQLIRSLMVSLLIPKMMGVEDFGYWQLFIFYTQYGGFLHLGLMDGIYLYEGGKRYDNLDFPTLGYQLRIFSIWQIIIVVPFLFYGFVTLNPQDTIVICFSCLFVLVNNLLTFFMYILQAVNLIKLSSLAKIIISLCFIISIIVLLCSETKDYIPYIIAYIVSHLLGLIVYAVNNKPIIKFFFVESTNERKKQLKNNIKIGFILLVSNLCGMLIIGFGRFMVDIAWGIRVFAYISFALMFVNFFLMFINQASLVLFPELRRWNVEKVVHFYQKLRNGMSLLSPAVFLLYAPIFQFVHLWLPKYEISMGYLVFLLPLCVFDTQMNLLCNTIYKVYGDVKTLVQWNMVALFFSVVLILTSIYVLKSIQYVVLSMLIAIAIRSVLAEIYLETRILKKQLSKNLIWEIMMILLFVCLHLIFPLVIAWGVYGIIYIIYMCTRKNLIQDVKS